MASSSPAQVKPRRRRWFRWLLGLCLALLLAAAAGAGLLVGYEPLRREALRAGIGSVLDAQVEVGRTSLGNPVGVARLSLGDREPGEASLAVVEDLRLWHAWRPGDKRYLPKVEMGRAQLSVKEHEGQANYDFVSRFLSQPGGDFDVTPFLPRRVLVHDAMLEADVPGWRVKAEGLRLDAAVDSLASWSVRCAGAPLRASWAVDAAPLPPDAVEGQVDVVLEQGPDVSRAHGTVRIPGLAGLSFDADLQQEGEEQRFAVNVDEAVFQQALWGRIAADYAPVPVSFEEAQLSGAHIEGAFGGAGLTFGAAGRLNMRELRVGPGEAPYYAGAFSAEVEGNMDPAAASALQMEALLADAYSVHGSLTGEEGAWAVELRWPAWDREAYARLLPPMARGYLDYLPTLEAAPGSFTGRYDAPGYRFSVLLSPSLRGGAAPELVLTGLGIMGPDGRPSFEGDAFVAMEAGRIQAAVNAPNPEEGRAEVELIDVALGPWLQAWTGQALEDLDGVISGLMDLRYTAGEGLRFEGAATLPDAAFGDWRVPEGAVMKAEFDGAAAPPYTGVEGKKLSLSVGEDTRVQLDNWRYALEGQVLRGAAEMFVALAPWAERYELGDWWGEATAKAQLEAAGASRLSLGAIEVTATTLGLGDYSLPYEMPLHITGEAAASMEPIGLRIGQATAGVGADTQARMEKLLAGGETGSDDAALVIEGLSLRTGFAPLVAEGYLESAEGHALLESDSLVWDPSGAGRGAFRYEAKVASLLMPDGMLAVTGLDAEGRVTLDGAMAGGGAIAAEEAIAFGAVISGLRTDAVFEGDTLYLKNMESNLFGGAVKAEAKAVWNETGPALSFEATAVDVDLSVFTTEFEPPGVTLTGRVDGSLRFGIGPKGGLTHVEASLAAEEGITMNRDMVEQILLSQYVEGTAGKAISKAIQRTIGKEPQRPFDRAFLDLRLEDAKIRGEARLESRLLNLTVDIKADPEALTEAVRLRQMERIEVEFDNAEQ